MNISIKRVVLIDFRMDNKMSEAQNSALVGVL